MAETNQYLRLAIGEAEYLLPGTMRYSIEPRDSLTPGDSKNNAVAAWRVLRNGKWPAYALGPDLRPGRPPANWLRALFLESAPGRTVGLVVNDAHLMGRGEVTTVAFTPPGPRPTTSGHLFNRAWVHENRVALVFEPSALIAYLNGLGT